MSVISINESNWQTAVQSSLLPVLVEFGASWCPHCQAMRPILDRLAQQTAGVAVVGCVDTDRERDLSHRYGIHGIPTMILFRNGQEVHRHSGESSLEQLEELLGVMRYSKLPEDTERVGIVALDREQLRAKLLDGADHLRNSAVWRFMSAEQRQLSSTGRAFWAANTAVTNAALDAFLVLLNTP